MGYHNANAVAVWHGGLPGASFKVLIRMALSTRDADDPPHYRGGPAPLLLSLGRHEVDQADTSDAARVMREANEKALQRAVQPLRALGLVTYAVTPGRGRTAEYHLHLHLQPVDKSAVEGDRGTETVPLSEVSRGTQTVPLSGLKGDGLCPDRGTVCVPPEKKEQMKDLDEEDQHSGLEVTSPQGSHKIDRPVGVSDHGCVRGWLPDPSGGRSTEHCPTCRPSARLA
jgi:hypothetical protein